MTSQVDINSKTKSIVIPCRFLMWWWWRWLHCFGFNPGPCTWDVLNDVCVHVPAECILCTLQNPVNRISFLAWKSIFQPVQTRLYTSFCPSWLCTDAAIFITVLCENLVVCDPGDWRCVYAHDCIALHILQPLFLIPCDSSLRKQMNTSNDSSGRIKCRPIEALVVSATHKSPSRIRR